MPATSSLIILQVIKVAGLSIDHFHILGIGLERSLQLRLMRGVFSDTNDFYLFLMIFSRRYETGLLH